MPGFILPPGMDELLAGVHETNPMFKTFEGDLAQMAAQRRFLKGQGISITLSGGLAGFTTKGDFERALPLLWERKPNGWHHYCDDYVAAGVCTKDEFTAALRASNDQ